MTTIPANLFVAVTPSVLGVGGEAIDVVALLISQSNRVPIGQVYSFSDGAAVASFFGAASAEAKFALGGAGLGGGYFAGFTGSSKLPGNLLVAQYNAAAVAAYLWGGNAGAALTLAQLQALSGSLTVVMDGYSHVISSIALSSYNSFSAAAAGIQAAFTDPTEASFTASIGGSGTTCTTTGTTLTMGALASGRFSVGDTITGTDGTNSLPAGCKIVAQLTGTAGGGAGATFTISAAATPGNLGSCTVTATSNVLDVTVDTDHAIAVGQTVTGGGVAAGTLITSQISGTAGGVGLYQISGSPQGVASEAMTGVATAPTVTYDSQSGAFVITSGITGAPSTAAFATGTLAAPLLLTSATGARLSQGAAATTPGAFMNAIVQITTDWVTYITDFDPDGGSGNTQKQAFAAWKDAYPNQYAYICWDTDITPTASVPATGSLGYILANNGDSGTCLIYEPSDLNLGAFVCGIAASIDFDATNGRTAFAFRSQAGIVPSVTSGQVAVNLGGNPQVQGSFGNGYNYYGAVGAANAGFNWFQRGTVTGPFKWLDSYINQIWWNKNAQLALLNLMSNSKSIPFNTAGANQIEAALADQIQAGLNFTMYAPGDISSSQAAEVNSAAGVNITNTIETQGYYLQVLQQSSTVRANRGPWAITFWYLDRGSVQSISLSSVALQ